MLGGDADRKLQHPTKGQMESSPAELGVTVEALQLLQELKKRRQECSHVKQFNTLLHQAIEQRRKEQDITGARRWPKANILERLSREEAARMASKMSQMLRLWKLRAFRSQHLLADFFQHHLSAFLKRRLLRSWHLACFDNASHVEDGLLEKQKLMEGVQTKVDHARQQLKRDCLHSRTKGLSLLECSARLQACRQVMTFWAAIAAVEVDRRSHMRLHVLFNRSSVEDFFHIWAEFSKRRQQSTSADGSVEKISERTLVAVAAPRLRVMLVLWRMAADLEAADKETPQVTKAAATESRVGKTLCSQLLLRTAAQHVRRIE